VATRGEVGEAAQRVSVLENEVTTACRTQGMAEEKILSLMAKVAATDW
jgi:hypothetical protein